MNAQISVIPRHSRGRMQAAPKSAGNTPRGLTHHLDLGERQAAVKATRICTLDGCQRPHMARGLCNTHYMRQARTGTTATSLRKMPAHERFKAKSAVDPSGCWIWTANADARGYGRFKHQGRMVIAHRWAYEHFIGPIPDGLEVDHLCNRPACVNPEHLEAVTGTENIRRRDTRRRLRQEAA